MFFFSLKPSFSSPTILHVYFHNAQSRFDSVLPREEFCAGKQIRRKQESLRPQATTIPTRHSRFRKHSNNKPANGQPGLLDGWLLFLSRVGPDTHRMFSYLQRTHAQGKIKKQHATSVPVEVRRKKNVFFPPNLLVNPHECVRNAKMGFFFRPVASCKTLSKP